MSDINPNEVGNWMLNCAIREWIRYDDADTFEVDWFGYGVILRDPDNMDMSVFITHTQFFNMHKELIWHGKITNYRHDWIDWAFKSNDADADDYDDLTCEAVLQNMLYGEIIYS
jgi:hypothetical protein